MAFTFQEKHGSRSVTYTGIGTDARVASISTSYIAESSIPDQTVEAAIAAADTGTPRYLGQDGLESSAPAADNDTILQRATIDSAVEVTVGELFEIKCSWTLKPTPDSSFQFSTTGASRTITQSLSDVSAWNADGAVAVAAGTDTGGGPINFDGQTVNGTDVVIPQYQMTIERSFDIADLPATYRAWLFFLTGKVNDAAFQGFDAGEVLFLGGSGTKRNGTNIIDYVFNFACSPNITNGGGPEPWDNGIKIGPITVNAKKGWEYVNIQYAPQVSPDASQMLQIPSLVTIQKVYDLGDFSKLGIDGFTP